MGTSPAERLDFACAAGPLTLNTSVVTSRLLIRVAGLVLAVGVVWYITHLNAELSRMRAAAPTAPIAAPAAHPAPAADAASATAPRSLTPEQRQAMLARLTTSVDGSSSTGHPVWFATIPNNPEAAAFQKTLQAVFEEAGWKVQGNAPIRFPMKAGIFVFAADEDPPDYLSQVNDAFEAAGLTITSGRGYRDFARQKKEENPSWVGLELGPDDTYVIAVGRRPEPEPAS
jgi:hypothetical protein